MTKPVLALFAHGARDPRWAEPFQRLQQLVQAQRPDANVALAFLELMSPGLPELAAQAALDGCTQLTVVPVFLGQGGHIRRDLPMIIDQLKSSHPQIDFSVVPAAGEDEDVLKALAGYCAGAARTK